MQSTENKDLCDDYNILRQIKTSKTGITRGKGES